MIFYTNKDYSLDVNLDTFDVVKVNPVYADYYAVQLDIGNKLYNKLCEDADIVHNTQEFPSWCELLMVSDFDKITELNFSNLLDVAKRLRILLQQSMEQRANAFLKEIQCIQLYKNKLTYISFDNMVMTQTFPENQSSTGLMLHYIRSNVKMIKRDFNFKSRVGLKEYISTFNGVPYDDFVKAIKTSKYYRTTELDIIGAVRCSVSASSNDIMVDAGIIQGSRASDELRSLIKEKKDDIIKFLSQSIENNKKFQALQIPIENWYCASATFTKGNLITATFKLKGGEDE